MKRKKEKEREGRERERSKAMQPFTRSSSYKGIDKAKRGRWGGGGGRIGWLREHLIPMHMSAIIFLFLNFWTTKDKCEMLEILPFILYICYEM